MKRFIIEWCRTMALALLCLTYLGIFFLVAFLLDGDKPQNALYIALWVLFYGVTTVTTYVVYHNNRRDL